MVRRPLLAALKPPHHTFRFTSRRLYATEPPASQPASRIARLESRLPRFLQRFTIPLRNAPVSHITAFLILHELTAIVPVLGLASAFHYTGWLPPYISEGKWVAEGVERFGRYMRKKGWISDAQEAEVEAEADGERKKRRRWWGSGEGEKSGWTGKWFGRGEDGVRLVVELGTAYAITKALLPLRLVVSVWCTPWFARWTVLPVTGAMKRMFGRGKGLPSAAAGTGAVAAGALPKEVGGRVK